MSKTKKCCICGTEKDDNIKIKKGYICESCLGEMPLSVQASIKELRPDQIQAIRKTYKRAFRAPWFCMGSLALTDTSIQLNGFEYDLKDLNLFEFKFHPLRMDEYPGYARGIITAVLRIREPAAWIEERFLDDDDCVARYQINGDKIHYIFGEDIVRVDRAVSRAIRTKKYDLSQTRMEWTGQEGREQRNGSERESDKRFKSKQENKNVDQSAPDAIEAAKQLFGIEGPFSRDELRRIRNEKVKLAHPDSGGNDVEFKEIMAAYQLLQQYAG